MISTTAAATASATRGNTQGFACASPRRILNASGAATGANPRANSRSSQSDIGASFQMRQPPLQRLVRAIEARRNGTHRAAQHFGDFLIRQSLGVAQHNDN